MRFEWRMLLFAPALVAGAAVHAAPPAPAAADVAPIFRSLTDCRAIADAAQRLACYDDKVAALQTAERAGDVVVADRAQMRETGKSLFGFGPLKLPIFGGRANVETPSQIEAKITGLRSLGYGKWEFVLDNGMRWRQTESADLEPGIGQPVVIRSGAMGGFFLRVAGAHGVRAMRVQ